MKAIIDLLKRLFGIESIVKKEEQTYVSTSDQSDALLEAKNKAKELVLEARDQAYKIKAQAEDDARRIKSQATESEKNLLVEKARIDTQSKELENQARTLRAAREAITKKEERIDELYREQKDKLEAVAGLTAKEAREEMLARVDKELAEEKSKRIRELEEDIKKNSEKLSQEILVTAMRHGATDFVVEYTTSKVKLPDEEIKGRIIGKEGRNIRRFEEATGVDLDLDANTNEVLISCFDPIRREVARMALERLIADGRIQPAKIEEIVEVVQGELEHILYKAGDDLCHRVGAYNIPKELVSMLGKFKFRFSYGQNMIEHTLEETKIGVAIAHELKANVDIVRLGCLFHDIGKIVTDDEGTHIDLGVDLLRKYKIEESVVNCVAEHHEDKPFSSIESAIVNLSDHVSGARPGARGEDYEAYVQRMRALEDAAKEFDGVDRAYAISAGREVRIYVKPERVDDRSTEYLAKEIAKKIELEQKYPGVVKVTVIRETRVTETAK